MYVYISLAIPPKAASNCRLTKLERQVWRFSCLFLLGTIFTCIVNHICMAYIMPKRGTTDWPAIERVKLLTS